MKKLLICLVLALAMPISSFAGSLDNFTRSRIYADDFFDVSASDWYYHDVSNAYEYGITDGYSDSEFAPYEPVSCAQAIAFGAKINAVYTGSVIENSDEEQWYTPYVEYALETGIIEEGVFSEKNMNKPATRAQVAYVLARSIDFTDLKNINTNINALPDVTAYDDFYNEILLLYRAGVVAGKDSAGRFYPGEYITRSEISAMISRLINKDARMSVVFEDETTSVSDGTKYDAVAIAEKASSAVFYIEIYDRYGQVSKSGSGFFISSDGVAVTNYHVIEEGYSAKVRLTDGTVYDVDTVLGYEKDRDIAIIQIAGVADVNYLEFADSSAVSAGESVFCIGSPLGLENTISTGVVSNVDRVEDGFSYIQISAPISSGSSGGAVLDDECKVIGISSAGYSEGQNLNLAIPINDVLSVERDKNVTLYEMTTGRKPTDSSKDEAGGLEGSLGSAIGYADNEAVPDFGKLNNISETKQAAYSDKIVTRTYNCGTDGVNAYISALYELGYYRQRSTRINGNLAMIFVGRTNAVLVEYNMYNSDVMVSYYYE